MKRITVFLIAFFIAFQSFPDEHEGKDILGYGSGVWGPLGKPATLYGVPLFGSPRRGARGYINIVAIGTVRTNELQEKYINIKISAGPWQWEKDRFRYAVLECNSKKGRFSLEVIQRLIKKYGNATMNVICSGVYKRKGKEYPIYTFYKNEIEALSVKERWTD